MSAALSMPNHTINPPMPGNGSEQTKRRGGYSPTQLARIASGLCFRCERERGKDGTDVMCRPCADQASERTINRRRDLIAQGLCGQCGEQRPKGLARYCRRHQDQINEKEARLRAPLRALNAMRRGTPHHATKY
jgi:hypothetical protein